MNNVKKALTVLVLLSLLVVSCASSNSKKEVPNEQATIVGFEKYGHANLDLTVEKIFEDGYKLGATVDLVFSNGYEFKDIPFFDGYYVKKGEPLLRAYPGHKTVAACINYGKIYEVANLKVGDTVTIKLSKREGALSEQVLNSLRYSNDRNDYKSDEVFANFREIEEGSIKDGKLYRSSSPSDNVNNRASIADSLIKKAGINTVVNLADSNEEIEQRNSASSSYYDALYKRGDVIALNMAVDFSSTSFMNSLVNGLKMLVNGAHKTPILLHCTEGKDRAGFTSALLEALCGADYNDIVEDYMESYENYYGITKENDPQRYSVIVKNNIDEMLKLITLEKDVNKLTPSVLQKGARNYLLKGGMTNDEIDKLISTLSN